MTKRIIRGYERNNAVIQLVTDVERGAQDSTQRAEMGADAKAQGTKSRRPTNRTEHGTCLPCNGAIPWSNDLEYLKKRVFLVPVSHLFPSEPPFHSDGRHNKVIWQVQGSPSSSISFRVLPGSVSSLRRNTASCRRCSVSQLWIVDCAPCALCALLSSVHRPSCETETRHRGCITKDNTPVIELPLATQFIIVFFSNLE